MQNRSGNFRVPAILEGTPGIYQRRQSPPRVPSTIAAPQRRKSGTPRSRFGSQSSCASTSIQIPEESQLITNSNEIAFQQQQRQSAARRPVPRTHPSSSSAYSRELSSQSFSDASHRTGLTVFRKSLTSSQSIGNVVQHEFEPKMHLASSAQNVLTIDPHSNFLSHPNGHRHVSSSLQSLSLSGKTPGSSILLDRSLIIGAEDELPLPPRWEVRLTSNNIRYYVDHSNQRTHWIHPLSREDLPKGWTKIFDEDLGVVYYKYVFNPQFFVQLFPNVLKCLKNMIRKF